MPPVPPPPDLDHERFHLLASLFDEPGQVRSELVDPFFAIAEDVLAKAQAACAEGDLKTAERSVHNLKGTALNLGAEALGQAAAALLPDLRAGRQPDAERLAALMPLYQRARTALEAALAG